MTTLRRETTETRVRVRLRLPRESGAAGEAGEPGEAGEARAAGDAAAPIATGEPFLDHMLVTAARYSGLELAVAASGDLRHHLVEDVAITIGMALRREVPATCRRYGAALVPMDDALVQVALDLGGRAWYDGPLPVPLAEHALRSFATNAAMTLHVVVVRGSDRHHVVEAAVKALGLALRQAMAPGAAVFSTKGAVATAWEEEP
jgi:imidazoleglycerol-phosphate dehydratase